MVGRDRQGFHVLKTDMLGSQMMLESGGEAVYNKFILMLTVCHYVARHTHHLIFTKYNLTRGSVEMMSTWTGIIQDKHSLTSPVFNMEIILSPESGITETNKINISQQRCVIGGPHS